MGKQLDHLTVPLQDFISQQKIFFVGTAAAEGRVNISPKGLDSFKVLGANKAVWLNLTGSGNETSAHLLKNSRITIMFCSFEKNPMILRLYGTAKAFHPSDEEFQEHIGLFPENQGSRQIIEVDIDLVQTSCGFAVPFMEFAGERGTLNDWADKKGKSGIEAYWQEKNQRSIDGFETGI